MNYQATGTFTVSMKPQGEPEIADGISLGQMALDKEYEGDLQAVGKGQMLTVLTAVDGSAGYVAIERVTGMLHNRQGSFVFQHSGLMDQGRQQLSIVVVPDSGTKQLSGITGVFTIHMVDGTHAYTFDYSLPD